MTTWGELLTLTVDSQLCAFVSSFLRDPADVMSTIMLSYLALINTAVFPFTACNKEFQSAYVIVAI